MIEFTTNRVLESMDLELSRIESLTELSKQFEHLLARKSPGSFINIALLPPLRPNISIPLAFKVLMTFVDQFKEKQLSLVCHLQSEEILDYLVKYLPPEMAPNSSFGFGEVKISICVADLIDIKVDAIVNASNRDLKLGGGVSGAIRNAANPHAQLILDRIVSSKQLEHGEAVLTDGLGVKGIRHIIHVAAVKGTIEVVRKSLVSVIQLCEENLIESVAIPAFGTGTGGLPVKACAKLFKEVFEERTAACLALRKIVIVLWRKTDYDTFLSEFNVLSTFSSGG